jgi:hypothetical protein
MIHDGKERITKRSTVHRELDDRNQTKRQNRKKESIIMVESRARFREEELRAARDFAAFYSRELDYDYE